MQQKYRDASGISGMKSHVYLAVCLKYADLVAELFSDPTEF